MSTVNCPNCGAPVEGNVPIWILSVQCRYCGASIRLSRDDGRPSESHESVGPIPPSGRPQMFDLREYSDFMRRRGYQMDPVSGALQVGSVTVYVNSDGNVDGPESVKRKVHKWIYEYMKQ